MKIAFSARGKEWEDAIDPRFGRSEYFLVYDEESQELSVIDNRDVVQEAHGAGPRTAQRLLDEKVSVLVTGNGPGGNAAGVLSRAGIKVYAGAGAMSIREAYQAYKAGKLPLY
ncbi:MAG: NifB/NifX family molybdenum-iron cluster-binding protein [Candidatus Neomarinimicrobiota bacterium]|jgi:predicted Fe-Mo cluster-binding NifX family protein|nr:NifB/NifX family molybdenum-iron cluster-binding protein [Candidatus Neomarinimicrobiota bacterium]MDD3966360.1 NifB/NifX family molybdenum-iron cluster-binding protein [Candidatus Neomarinimicrobiota bacterium]MDX9780758.1 NifB/NifX family molybdenum-iron cluster-binding protein [bacterium]